MTPPCPFISMMGCMPSVWTQSGLPPIPAMVQHMPLLRLQQSWLPCSQIFLLLTPAAASEYARQDIWDRPANAMCWHGKLPH